MQSGGKSITITIDVDIHHVKQKIFLLVMTYNINRPYGVSTTLKPLHINHFLHAFKYLNDKEYTLQLIWMKHI